MKIVKKGDENITYLYVECFTKIQTTQIIIIQL